MNWLRWVLVPMLVSKISLHRFNSGPEHQPRSKAGGPGSSPGTVMEAAQGFRPGPSSVSTATLDRSAH